MATPYAIRKISPHIVRFIIAKLQTIFHIQKFMNIFFNKTRPSPHNFRPFYPLGLSMFTLER